MCNDQSKYGLFRGRVVAANDPEKRGRIRALVPAALKDQKSNWCEPLVRPTASPKVNDVVYVQFIDGDISQPVYSLPLGTRRDIEKVQKQLDQVQSDLSTHDHPHTH